MEKLCSLWSGKLPLHEAFWTWAISVGLPVNVTTSVLFLVMITVDRPWAAMLFGLCPFGALQFCGYGRRLALGRALSGPGQSRLLACVVTIVVMLLLTVT